MVELIKLEVVKLCRRKLTVMVTLCCFAGTVIFFLLPYLQFHTWDETGNMLSGKAAVLYRKEIYIHTLSGVLTDTHTGTHYVHNPDCSGKKNTSESLSEAPAQHPDLPTPYNIHRDS